MLSRTSTRAVAAAQASTRRAAVAVPRRWATTATPSTSASDEARQIEEQRSRDAVRRDTRRNPELYVLAAIMSGAFGLAGYFFAAKPTSASSETAVSMADKSYPWESGTSGKYQYHPGGDRTLAPRDAPSALHSVVIPNVNLPKHLHESFNKYDKEEFDDY